MFGVIRWLAGKLFRGAATCACLAGFVIAITSRHASSHWAGLGQAFGGFALMTAGAYIYRGAQRIVQPDARAALAADPRQPVLWLRSFGRDNLPLHRKVKLITPLSDDYFTTRAQPTFEELLVAILARRGPVIALGRPGERIAPLGASRETVAHDKWQDRVRDYLERAQLAVVIVDDSESLLWELREALCPRPRDDGTTAGPSVLLVPPPDSFGFKDRRDGWLRSYDDLRGKLANASPSVGLPPMTHHTAGVIVAPGEPPQEIVARSSDVYEQLGALALASSRIRTEMTAERQLDLPGDDNYIAPFSDVTGGSGGRVLRELEAGTVRPVSNAQVRKLMEEMSTIRTMLFADVVGYSKLEGEHTPRFMYEFLSNIAAALRALLAQPLMINTWGDGIFAVMATATDMARYAFVLRDAVATGDWRQRGLPAELAVRIALHAGPVFEAEDPITRRPNYYGSRVNRPARIEPVAVPDQVFASEAFVATLVAEAVYRGQPPQFGLEIASCVADRGLR